MLFISIVREDKPPERPEIEQEKNKRERDEHRFAEEAQDEESRDKRVSAR